MKIGLIFSIILFSVSALAAEYILYPLPGKDLVLSSYLKTNYQVNPQAVFTVFEVKNMDLPESIKKSFKLKIDSTLDEKLSTDSFIRENSLKLEKNSTLTFLENKKGEYEYLQWGLENNGVAVEIKLTDIDRLSLQAARGEDVNVGSIKEVAGRKIRVAVIDSGIDLTHPDFKGRIYQNDSECKAWDEYQSCLSLNIEDEELTKSCHTKWAKVDTDQNGYPMDCRGWNVAAQVNPLTGVQGNNDVMDLLGHGTHISGIIGAVADEKGVSGIIQNVEILPVKVSGSTEEVKEDNTTDIFAKGILYALKQNVDIINLSVGWSSSEDSLLVSELIKKAHELGVLVVVAGGNSAHSTETYPCAYNEVICVGSHNPDGSRSHFSNFGSSIDIFAPGHNILSTWPIELRPKLFTERHGFEFKNGTSFSSPFTVGVLARLLNLGFSADEARVKLLAGARKSILNPKVLNGHVDLEKAVAFKTKSFIYPIKKSAAFMNWHEGEKKLILKLKNYLQTASNVTIKIISTHGDVRIKEDTKIFESWVKDETKEITYILDGSESVPSEMSFNLIITSSDEQKSYPIQAVATTVIHDKFSRPDTERLQVQTNRDLEKFDFYPFENITSSHDTDFLISQIVDGKLIVGLLKVIDGNYKLSKLHSTIFDKALIIQAAKVDIDLDGKAEYVLTGMYQNSAKKWAAKFYVFDENFKPSEIQICPNNELVNLLTSMGTELKWMKKNKRMVPTWISPGYAPSIDLPKFDPWSAPVVNQMKKRIYYLDEKGLRTLYLPSVPFVDFGPMEFFTQTSDDLKEGKIKFLYTSNEGFKKTISMTDTSSLNHNLDFIFPTYQNLYPIDGITHANSQTLLFSESDPNTGAGRLSVLNPNSLNVEQLEYDYLDFLDPIQLVLSQTSPDSFFALTKYNLLYLEGGKFHKTESRNVSHQIQYKRTKTKNALYLSSEHTPGMSSELVEFDRGQITRPAKYRFLMGNGCQEIGYNYSTWEEQDQILFYCDNSKSIFKIRL